MSDGETFLDELREKPESFTRAILLWTDSLSIPATRGGEAALEGEQARDDRAVQPSSIYRYVGAFGHSLIELLGGQNFWSLPPDDVVHLLQSAIRLQPVRTQGYSYAVIRRFYSFAVDRLSAPEIDWDEVADTLGNVPEVADAGFVTREEMERCRKYLGEVLQQYRNRGLDFAHAAHLLRQAGQQILLSHSSGFRASEAAFGVRKDYVGSGAELRRLVRWNVFARIKNGKSRVVPIGRAMDVKALNGFDQLLGPTESRKQADERRNEPLFPMFENPRRPNPSNRVRPIISATLKAGTGNESARQHWLRRSALMREVLVGSRMPVESIDTMGPPAFVEQDTHPVLRGLAVRLYFGHSEESTAFRNYWCLGQFTDARRMIDDIQGRPDVELARWFGVDETAMRVWRSQTRNSKPTLAFDKLGGRIEFLRYLTTRHDVRTILPGKPHKAPRMEFSRQRRGKLNFFGAVRLLGDFQLQTDPQLLFVKYPVTPRQLAAAAGYVDSLAKRTGFALIDDQYLSSLMSGRGATNGMTTSDRGPPASAIQIERVLASIPDNFADVVERLRSDDITALLKLYGGKSFDLRTPRDTEIFRSCVATINLAPQQNSDGRPAIPARHFFFILLAIRTLREIRDAPGAKRDPPRHGGQSQLTECGTK